MRFRLLLSPLLLIAFAGANASVVPTRVITIDLAPGRMDESSNGGDVNIVIRVPGMSVNAGDPLFRSPVSAGLQVSDDAGPLTVHALAEKPGSRGSAFAASRDVKGDLVIRYLAKIQNTPDNGGTTPIFPRLDGNAFSAIGMTLLAVPETHARYRLAIKWDLSAMGAGARGVSSLGDGNVEAPVGPVDRIEHMVVMAGQLQRVPKENIGRFEAVWAGQPPFDPRSAMRWTETLHDWMLNFFGTQDDPAYRVFLRNNGGRNAGGGVAFPNSFFATWGPGVTGEGLKTILSHEMTHTFTANDLGRWYVEGDAVYYQVQLPWRAGLATTGQYLRDINLTASRYYTNAKMHAPEADIDPNFFKDGWLNTLAYDRGALYFAQLNSMMRRKTAGKRSIDDLVRVMVRKGRGGETITNETWYDLLRENIGPDAVTFTRSMLSGGLVLPPSDAYGPCFRRYAAKIRRYQLGFDVERKVPGQPAVISNVIAGSEAARAGLQNGDAVILPALTSEGTRRDPEATVTASVMRNGKSWSVTWLPRGEAIDAYQWERVPGVPDSSCRPAD